MRRNHNVGILCGAQWILGFDRGILSKVFPYYARFVRWPNRGLLTILLSLATDSRKLRITLAIGSIENAGGSERSLTMLANSWAEMGRAVTILTFDRAHVPAYSLHSSINLCHLSLYGWSRGWLQRARRILWRNSVLRQAIRGSRPDIIVSFTPEANVRSILATRGLHIPVIVSERNDPSLCYIGKKWENLRRVAYPFAEMLVCQTGAALTKFQKMIKVNGAVIPNLIAVPRAWIPQRVAKDVEKRDYVLVAMGRLVPQKGFDILLRAFAQIMQRHSSWSLKILGTGPLRDDLQKLTEHLNMTGRVHFAGLRMEPFADLCQANLFVLSSRFEGFPNALCEAMACGLPAVSFDCPSGPSDIVRDGVDGILVPPEDCGALAGVLDNLMTDRAKRERLASRAPEIVQRFAVERVLALWDKAFAEVQCESHW